jgi:hypothetical protein
MTTVAAKRNKATIEKAPQKLFWGAFFGEIGKALSG